MIDITFNGKTFTVKEGETLLSFLEQNNLQKEKIAIEINLEIIPKSSYQTFVLQKDMKIEAIVFVGGG